MKPLKWWETAVIYQIYPRSFQDSNGDGIGDIPGITTRLDYISNLGVDAIWISPFFKSPQNDFGYDVSDYCDINPEYGTLVDFDNLLEKAHSFNLKVMVDFVPAHCSDQHSWFLESRKSKDNLKADWFHWVDPKKDGSAPTNWLSFFGGRAWTWEPRRQQYYLHNFLPSQPNLNHSNPDVCDALMKIVRFWFDRGVDGFRLDAVHTINGDKAPYKDNLTNLNFKLGSLPQDQQPFFRQLHCSAQLNQPVIQNFSKAIRSVADNYNDRFLMGEVDGDNDTAMEVSETFTAPGRLHATYNFDLLAWGGLTVKEMKVAISKAIKVFNKTGRISFAFSNHDVPRVASRQLAPLGLSIEQGDLMQLLLLKLETCLIGSACIYQGEELGLEDSNNIPIEQLQDPWGIEFAPTFQGRDSCRTPMVWNSNEANGGFSDSKTTWLPVMDDHFKRSGLSQAGKSGSIYSEFSSFLQWRKKQPAFMEANEMTIPNGGLKEIIFTRKSEKQNLRCIFDFEKLVTRFEEI
ncbi:MAG: alpha-amylase family glycosyl hydrolase [Paracoccaceae bacterium]|nr:alpha-amylase family glycosyl hydrolase [Paracoccaceae bacterium]